VPAELRASVAVCLTELNLTDFLAAIEGSDISSQLTSSDADVTVFAPTNSAINGQFLSQANLRAHFLDEVVRNSDLRSYSVLRPITEETLLHVTDVHEYTMDMGFTEETFINGAEVNTSDACLAENGIVHTVNSIIPSSPDSIAELLAADPQFNIFTRLLDAANITQFLSANRNTSRTVFAPTNNAFTKLPAGAVECLLRPENKKYAQKLVLIHITAPAEYTSSLSQRSYIKTFYRHYHYCYRLLVCVINGTIHLTRDNIPLDETDITARNGVIHTLQTVLLSSDIDYEEICPDIPVQVVPTPAAVPPIAVEPSPVPPIAVEPSPVPPIAVEPSPVPPIAVGPSPVPPVAVEPSPVPPTGENPGVVA
jgi:uncharacterized surface protein with fasciclin (FAS1) repeats